MVGGGFDDLGGQNILQPLARGVPTLHGPHMRNFRDVSALALASGATEVVADAASLRGALERLLEDPPERARRGGAALALFDAHAGAADRYAEALIEAAIEGRARAQRTTARLKARRG